MFAIRYWDIIAPLTLGGWVWNMYSYRGHCTFPVLYQVIAWGSEVSPTLEKPEEG